MSTHNNSNIKTWESLPNRYSAL